MDKTFTHTVFVEFGDRPSWEAYSAHVYSYESGMNGVRLVVLEAFIKAGRECPDISNLSLEEINAIFAQLHEGNRARIFKNILPYTVPMRGCVQTQGFDQEEYNRIMKEGR